MSDGRLEAAARRQGTPQFQNAFWRGVKARRAGKAKHCCPYEDTRQHTGRLTWSRAYRNSWMDGWKAAGGREPVR